MAYVEPTSGISVAAFRAVNAVEALASFLNKIVHYWGDLFVDVSAAQAQGIAFDTMNEMSDETLATRYGIKRNEISEFVRKNYK